MAKRRKARKEIYEYECTLTGEKFKVHTKANNPDDLVSVAAYYELNPEKDDRPENLKKKIEIKKSQSNAPTTWEELVALSKESSPKGEADLEEEENEE
jgi:transketolase